MIEIKNIELNKKFTAIHHGFKAVINYRIYEDWFSVYYYDTNDNFILKDVKNAYSEQKVIRAISEKIVVLNARL